MPVLAARSITILAAVASLASAATVARAQVVRPPIGGGAIDAARKNVAKTNEQTKAAEQAGGAQTQKKAAPPATQQAQQKAAPPAQKGAAAPGKAAAAPPQKGTAKAAPPKAGQKAGSKADTATGQVSQAGGRRAQVTVMREAFTYSAAGRRDPFVSLMLSGELRPIITDLSLTGVLYDPDPRKSLAMLVDASTGEAYRVKQGQPLGRMRVQRIGREDVTFSIEEFGLSRTETLVIDRSKKGPAAARRP